MTGEASSIATSDADVIVKSIPIKIDVTIPHDGMTTTLSIDKSLNDLFSKITKQDFIDIISALHDKGHTFWLQDYQFLAAGLCAIAAASIAYLGVRYSSRTLLKIEKEKHDRVQSENMQVWERKKRFFVFHVLNASAEVEKYVEYVSRHIKYADGDDEMPDEFYVFRSDLTLDEQCDLYFQNIYDALERISFQKSAYPLHEHEIKYMRDEELEELNSLGFRIASLQAKSKEIQDICRRLLKNWVPDIPDKEWQRFIQDDAHKLVQVEINTLTEETQKLMDLIAGFARIFAPEIAKKWEEVRNQVRTRPELKAAA